MNAYRMLLVTFGALAISACASQPLTERPKLDFQGLGIEDLSFTTATFMARFNVENPSSHDVKIDRVRYTLKMNGMEMGTGDLKSEVEIDGREKELVSLPIKIKYKDLVRAFQSVANKPDAPQLFALSGIVKSGSYELPFEETGEFEFPIPIPTGKKD